MSQAFDQVVGQLHELSLQEKNSLRMLLDHQSAANKRDSTAVSAFGWAKGQVSIGPDFDEPIDDFKDYVA
jgi:hypothetical protein